MKNNIFLFLSVFILSVALIVGCGSGDRDDKINATSSASTDINRVPLRRNPPDDLKIAHTNSNKPVIIDASHTLFANKEYISASSTGIYDPNTLTMKFNNKGILVIPDGMNIKHELLYADNNKELYVLHEGDKTRYLAFDTDADGSVLYELVIPANYEKLDTHAILNKIDWNELTFSGMGKDGALITKNDWKAFKHVNGVWVSGADKNGLYHGIKISRNFGDIDSAVMDNKDEVYKHLKNKSVSDIDVKKSYILSDNGVNYMILHKKNKGKPYYIALDYVVENKKLMIGNYSMQKYSGSGSTLAVNDRNRNDNNLGYNNSSRTGTGGGTGTYNNGNNSSNGNSGNNNNSGGNENNSGNGSSGNNNNSGGNENNSSNGSSGNNNNSGGNENNSSNGSSGNNNNSGGNENNSGNGNSGNNNNSGGNENNSGNGSSGNNNNSGGNSNNSGNGNSGNNNNKSDNEKSSNNSENSGNKSGNSNKNK